MSDLPFGFGPSDRDPERDPERDPDEPGQTGGPGDANPFAMFGLPAGADAAGLFAQIGQLLSWTGGPVNWDLARQVATSGLDGSRLVGEPDRVAVRDAVRLADLWLDDVTDLPSGVRTAEAWSRSDWVARTMTGWADLVEPVATTVVGAMGRALPPEIAAQAGPLGQVMSSVGGLMFGAQVGQGIAGLATETLSGTEVGIPLVDAGVAALLPQNIRELATDLERPEDEVRLYVALREAAALRLHAASPWLRADVVAAVAAYAKGINLDPSALQDAMGRIDPTDPASMQAALGGGMFTPDDTPQQRAALARLETLLALVEGWIDTVVDRAAADRLGGAPGLREAMRRRRATGGPAEQTFATLVGLELRPRRLRDAATLWWALTDQVGVAGRDALWQSPDRLPGGADLDDPIDAARRIKAGQDVSADDAAAVIAGFEALTARAAEQGDPPPDQA